MAGGGFGTAQGGFPQQPGFAGPGSAGPGAPPPQGGFPQQPGQMPQQPGQPQLNDPLNRGGMPFQRPLPEGYQSPYANYGFDPKLQSYLDNSYLGSMTDAGVGWNYDPTNQTFTGGTMSGQYNPIPLSVMQGASNGTGPGLNSYFQSRFPQPTGPAPTVKPGMPQFPQGPVMDPQRPQRPQRFQRPQRQSMGLPGLMNRR